MKHEISLEELDKRLRRATRLLDDCAATLRDLDFNAHQNIKRVGDALVQIFAIQDEIYQIRPDLMPDFLKKPLDSAMADDIRRQVYELRPDLRPDQLKGPPDAG